MRKKNLTKAVETTVAPNPKEVDIWVEPKDDNTVSLKYYDYHDNEWVGGSDGGSKGAELLINWSDGAWVAIDVETMEIIDSDGHFDGEFPILELQRVNDDGERWYLKPSNPNNVSSSITRACLIQHYGSDDYHFLLYNTPQSASYTNAEYLGGITCEALIVDGFAAIKITNSTKNIHIDNVWKTSNAPS